MRYRFLLLLVILGTPLSARAQTIPQLYMDYCAICHLPGIAGAPRVGDRTEWTRRVRAGLNSVYRNALEGMPNTAMMAKGGHAFIRDDELRAIVDYMIAAASLPPDALKEAARYDAFRITNRDFVRLDANFDGYLSRDEVAADAALARNYARFDTDRDGRLGVVEYENAEITLERERMAVRTDDSTLIVAVRAAIARVKGIDSANTRVDARDGVVTMVGIVDEAEIARLAYDALKRIPGIQKIDNRLMSGHQMGWD